MYSFRCKVEAQTRDPAHCTLLYGYKLKKAPPYVCGHHVINEWSPTQVKNARRDESVWNGLLSETQTCTQALYLSETQTCTQVLKTRVVVCLSLRLQLCGYDSRSRLRGFAHEYTSHLCAYLRNFVQVCTHEHRLHLCAYSTHVEPMSKVHE
jgi:hypothetical protein